MAIGKPSSCVGGAFALLGISKRLHERLHMCMCVCVRVRAVRLVCWEQFNMQKLNTVLSLETGNQRTP